MWAVLLVVVLVLAIGGYGVKALLLDGKESGRTYPKAWDARIEPYVKIAQKKRGLTFLHPVEVRFLPPAEFEKTVTVDEKELDKDDREEIEQFTGLMRAVGLLSGDVDLFKAFNEVRGGGTLAYYSFEDERITVRGEKVTSAVRATLVHELTHVLQDQYFKIGDRVKRLQKESEDKPSTSESSVLDGIIEGDAERVAGLYEQSLPPKQRRALQRGSQKESAEAIKRLRNVPKVVLTMVASPYTLGEGLVQVVAADGGNDAVDDLFRDTPTHETALLDPLRVLSDDTGATKVALPDVEDGEKKLDSSGEFGVLTWYLMLAERLPLQTALATVDGWGGDAHIAFTRDGTSCMRAAYEGETPADTTRMLTSLDRWIAAGPGSSATVKRDGDLVRFESCDPGKSAAGVGKDASQDAVDLLTIRASLGVTFLKGGLGEEPARCLAGKLVREYPVSSLTDPKFGADDASVQARVRQLATACR